MRIAAITRGNDGLRRLPGLFTRPLKNAVHWKDQRGLTLLELLAAMGILGFIGVGFMAALTTGFRGEDIKEEQVLGHNLVRAALEEIRSQDYLNSADPSPYEPLSTPLPQGYTIDVVTEDFCWPEPCTPDGNLQKNTATVFHDGTKVIAIEDLKARR